MIRLFDQHKIRFQEELDGVWKFKVKDGKEYSLPVPGCWEQHPDLLNYRGEGDFYRKVYVREKTNLRLEFKGVSHTADVYFDDAFLMHHYNAFTAFSGVVEGVEPGEHTIRVHVDNSFSEASALHVPNDYYTYGGIIRPVAAEYVKFAYIKNIHVKTIKNVDKWAVKVTVDVDNLSAEDKDVKLCVSLAGSTVEKEIRLSAKTTGTVELNMEPENVKEWTQETPELYMIKAELYSEGCPVDDLYDRFGFREITVKEGKMFINGKRFLMKGFNRHEDYGTLGSAVPFQVMLQDLELMRETGANAVRTCHYPNDERFLDLCDELGFFVWEENHARGFNLRKMQNPNFDRQCKDCIDEMIYQHYNHPAIVIWGLLNECASETEEGRVKYACQYEEVRKLDDTRPVTHATCRHFTDICLDLPDVVSFNMYSGWYEDIDVSVKHEQEMKWINEAGGAGKPVIVSEFGAAAIYGFRDRGRSKWSEERQADIIEDNLKVYENDDRISGVFIWQFADCKVTEEEWWTTRARCHNNKGVVDEYRRPKESFDVIKEYYKRMTRNQ